MVSMYFIKKIAVNDKLYKSSRIVDYTNNKISTALMLLENAARNYIKEEFGREASEQAKILDIYGFEQVSEPIDDCVLLYRLGDDPHHIHVYRKKTFRTEKPGYIYGSTIVEEKFFKRTHIFELEECEDINIITPQVEMVPVGFAGIKIPKPLTVAPFCNLISELKKSPKFQARFIETNAGKKSIQYDKQKSSVVIIEEHSDSKKD